jgi:uncharacterized protein YceK
MRATHLLVLLLPFASGCGTLANLDGREYPLMGMPGQIMPRPFGGVARDVKWMFILDLPLSLIGDVVTLPKTIPYLWMSEDDYRRDYWGSDED